MYNEKTIVELVIKQILAGLASGFVGLIIPPLLEPLIFGRILDLFGSIFLAISFSYISIYIGITIASISYLGEKINKSQIAKILLFTFPVLPFSIYGFIFIDWAWAWPLSVCLVIYPIVGVVYSAIRVLHKKNVEQNT